MSFTFQGTGTKYVRLTVTDARSQVASVEHNVVVGLSASTPTIASFTPAGGLSGAIVTISGTNFTGASAVRFNGVSAGFTVTSATAIQATAPAGVSTGFLTVTTPAGTATSANVFTVFVAPVPQFTYSPASP